MTDQVVDPRYPIGKFEAKESYSAQELKDLIDRIEAIPAKLQKAAEGLNDQQLDTPYREGGWTVRQVLHHVPDSHMNAYIRTKWTLTESTPTIKAYDEKSWAETPETKNNPSISIDFLRALHIKWVILLRKLSSDDLSKEYYHPDSKKHWPLSRVIALYAWHGDHHLAHITTLKKRMGWR